MSYFQAPSLTKQSNRGISPVPQPRKPRKPPNLFLKEFTKILESGEFSDTEILVGKEPNAKTFKLHSFVLRTCIPYYRNRLSDRWEKTKNNIIKLEQPDITIPVFDIIIK